jgi:hypothetical protein
MGKPKRRRSPLPNDLLHTCPVGMPTRTIAAALGASGYWVADVSVREWKDSAQDEEAFWHVAHALGYRAGARFGLARRLKHSAPSATLAKGCRAGDRRAAGTPPDGQSVSTTS